MFSCPVMMMRLSVLHDYVVVLFTLCGLNCVVNSEVWANFRKRIQYFSLQTFWLVIAGKAQVLLVTLTMALLSLSIPVSHDSEPVCTIQGPETSWEKWNSAIFKVNNNGCFSYCAMSAVKKVLSQVALNLLNTSVTGLFICLLLLVSKQL